MTNDYRLTHLGLARRHGTAGPLGSNQRLYQDDCDSSAGAQANALGSRLGYSTDATPRP
jgi:hypothetical protein